MSRSWADNDISERPHSLYLGGGPDELEGDVSCLYMHRARNSAHPPVAPTACIRSVTRLKRRGWKSIPYFPTMVGRVTRPIWAIGLNHRPQSRELSIASFGSADDCVLIGAICLLQCGKADEIGPGEIGRFCS